MIKRLSLSITLIAIYSILYGAVGLLKGFSESATISIPLILHIVAGIGLLFQKFWALRLTQGLLIIAILSNFAIFFLAPEIPFIYSLIVLIITDALLILLLIYLTKKKILAQFIDLDDDTEGLEIEKKKSTSLLPVFRNIAIIVYYFSAFLFLILTIHYAFEWWGNWAYLLALGIFLPLIPFTGLLSNIILFPPIFIFIFWRYEQSFPWWIIGLWALCFASQYIFGFLISKEESEIYDTNQINL